MIDIIHESLILVLVVSFIFFGLGTYAFQQTDDPHLSLFLSGFSAFVVIYSSLIGF